MVIGRYVARFADANMGMLEGVSLNAPYKFHWVYIKKIDGKTLFCRAGQDEIAIKFRAMRDRDEASVVIEDPIFGKLRFKVLPFYSTTGGA